MIATRKSGARAFTLIEILVSFFLLILIIGVGVLSISSISEEKSLVDPASKLKAMARKSLQMAITNRRSFAIAFGSGGFVLQSGAAPGEVGEEAMLSLLPAEERAARREVEAYSFEDDMFLEIRRWGERNFRAPERDLWVFEPSGICEPLSVRLVNSYGVVEMEFNPLTAKVSDETLILDPNYYAELQ